MKRTFIFSLISCLLPASLASGQVTGNGPSSPNSVTVTASRNGAVPPDQVVLAVTVASPIGSTRDNIVAVLQGTGITLANFTGIASFMQGQKAPLPPQVALIWSFDLPVALSDMKSVIQSLTAAQSSIAKNNPGLALSFQVQGTQVSPQAQQSQACAAADLMADARAKAQKLASAAGQALGLVLSISGSSVVTDPGSGILPSPASLPVCLLTVRFALGTGTVDGDTVNIVASRPAPIVPDLAIVGVMVDAGPALVLDDIVNALKGSGITAANLTTTYSFSQAQGQSTTQWAFALPVTFAKLKDTLAAFAQVQQAAAAGKPPLAVSYSVQGAQVSPELQASQSCPTAALLGDAQNQARKLASAAGAGIGPVVALSDANVVGIPTIAERSGGFSFVSSAGAVLGLQRFLLASPPLSTPACSLAAQFKLLR